MNTLVEKITQYINELISLSDSNEYTYEFSIGVPIDSIDETHKTYNIIKYDNMYTIDFRSNNTCKTLSLGNVKPTVALVLGHIDHFGFDRTKCSITRNWNFYCDVN